ncbi:MAG: response regulator [Oscillochloris sp.]|nr:response regulator [Oscillochloris sp.]
MRILLVDDNPLMQQVLSHYLESQGYTVVVAEDGAEALALGQQGGFQVCMIDMRLPDQEGPEILAALRALPSMRTCPAIAVSGLGEKDRGRTLAAGFNAFLAKPIDLDALVRTLEHLAEPGSEQAVGVI